MTSGDVPAAVGLRLGSAGVRPGFRDPPHTAGGRTGPRQPGVCFRKSGFKTCAPGSMAGAASRPVAATCGDLPEVPSSGDFSQGLPGVGRNGSKMKLLKPY